MFKKKFLFVLLLLLIIPTFLSLLKSGYFPMHDDMQAMRLLQLDKCVRDDQIPCRWVPDMGYGYGYPQFNFYPPLPYYFMEVFHFLGLGYLDSVKAGFVLSVLISAGGMYLLGSSLWGTTGGFVSALLYSFAPYRAVNMYVRGAVGEFWALGFLPIIIWAARNALKGDRRAVLWLALSLTGLFTSHNITTLIFIPVFIAWIVFQYFFPPDSLTLKLKRGFKNVVLGTIWGFSLGAYFLLPAWFERKFVHVETLLQGYFNYLAHFVSLKQLLFSTYWGYGSSELGPYDDISFAVGLLHWLLPLLAVVLLVIFKKKRELLRVIFFVLVGWITLFLTHLRSSIFWDKLAILTFLQFPWRFLAIATFSFSAASGSIALLFSKKRKFIFWSLTTIVLVVFLLYSNYFRPKNWIDIDDAGKFSGELWEKQLTISIFDYLPIYAELPPAKKAPDEPIITQGEAEIISGKKGTNWQRWRINVLTDEVVLQLSLYDFPGWKVWIDEKETVTSHENELGLITITLVEGNNEVFAKLTDTPVRTLGNFLTLTGLVTIPLFLRGKRKV